MLPRWFTYIPMPQVHGGDPGWAFIGLILAIGLGAFLYWLAKVVIVVGALLLAIMHLS